MNGEDEFERRLRTQPKRPVPPVWREEILRAARSAAVSTPRQANDVPSSTSALMAWVWSLLWPNPRAWAGLAALWLVVLGLNLATREPPGVEGEVAERSTRQSPQIRELLRQQEQLLAELVGPMGKTGAERPKPAAPQPRSQRRDEFLNT